MDLITIERWFIEAIIVIAGGFLVIGMICWFTDQINKDD